MLLAGLSCPSFFPWLTHPSTHLPIHPSHRLVWPPSFLRPSRDRLSIRVVGCPSRLVTHPSAYSTHVGTNSLWCDHRLWWELSRARSNQSCNWGYSPKPGLIYRNGLPFPSPSINSPVIPTSCLLVPTSHHMYIYIPNRSKPICLG